MISLRSLFRRAETVVDNVAVWTPEVLRVMCSNPHCAGAIRVMVGRRPRRESACSHRCARKVRTLLQRPSAPDVRLGLRANRRGKMHDPIRLARRKARNESARELELMRQRIWDQRQAVA